MGIGLIHAYADEDFLNRGVHLAAGTGGRHGGQLLSDASTIHGSLDEILLGA